MGKVWVSRYKVKQQGIVMTLLVRPALGLLQGIIIYWLMKHTPFSFAGMMSAAIVLTFPLFALQVKLPEKNTLALGLRMLAVMAVIYGYAAYHLLNELAHSATMVTPILATQCAASAFIFFIFYCVAIEEKRFAFPYTTLFSEAWQVILKLSLGKILVLLTWGLFWLGAVLFELLNISFLKQIVNSTEFVFIMLPCFFGVAMVILHEHEGLLTKLRNILLAFCHFLYPLFIVINLSFLLTIPFANKVFSELWEMTVPLNILNILLFNGIYQGGLDKPPYASWFCKLLYASMIMTFVYSLYILKFPWQTMRDYGFKPDSFLLLFNLSILAIYNTSHCVAIFFNKKPWLCRVKTSNTRLAILIALLYLMMAMPWFHLSKFASDHQLARFLNNQPITDAKHPYASPGFLEGANLQQADLHGKDLSRFNFSNANLEGANLSHTNLQYAKFKAANLHKANLSGASLEGADLTDANLSDASLKGANLTMVWFNNVNLNHTDLSHTDLRRTYSLPQATLDSACGQDVLLQEKLTIKPCKGSSNE